ncbi:type VII secretion system-associated protein [Occultella gossypii]|uniref:Type VII secretion system-associated protein n=1 Tax=Occultella gossypii TaxID=2800820 RepID=A0ABS7SBD2_9MICO|nr:type VII secretion system-associated protein [Occultella gossypii]MBZ2196568.1 type VII secretion system-associated protein [Occultella gossypii]
MTNPPATPPITDALRAEARANPGAWVYAVDPEFDPAGRVPPQGIVGAWRADENGELSEEFTPNPRYVPSPLARGWATPATKLERVLQLVLAGHAPGEQMDREFASAEVVIFSRPEGGIFLAPAGDGSRLAYAFTDADKATASGHAEHSVILGSQLAAALPEGVRIALNPGSEVSAIIDPADIRST